MRTLVAFHIGGVGGPQRSLPGVVSWLADRGEVVFLVPVAGPTQEDFSAFGAVRVLPYEALTYARSPWALARQLARLARDVRLFRRALRAQRPDLAIAVTTVLPAFVLAARLERVPVVVYAAELYAQEWKGAVLLRAWGAILARATARLAAGIVCCSRAVADQFPTGRAPVVVAYPPIDQAYAAGDRVRGRARLGLPASAHVIATVGSISRGRGQDVALRALAELRRGVPDAHLAVVGDPHPRRVDLAYAAELRSLAADLGLGGVVTFAGDATAGRGPAGMADVYAAADVVVNPARFAEPFGRVAPEALVAGRPVAASRVGGIPEVLRDGVDALLVEPDDPVALAGAVARLLADDGLAARLVATGRDRALRVFGAEQDLAAWRSVLEPVVAAT